jgi:leucyl-tRNA synthetase
MWGKLGKEGLAIKAPWPVADKEDKMLTRQAVFLRSGLKKFRSQVGKAKKAIAQASILVADTYPQWKVDILLWMQEQYNEETNSFAATFMKDLKGWTGQNISDKKLIKFAMQFAAFMKSEVAEVGRVALDVHLPFDQQAVLEGSMKYIKSQLVLENIDILKVETATDIPERIQDQATPGNPYLWLR